MSLLRVGDRVTPSYGEGMRPHGRVIGLGPREVRIRWANGRETRRLISVERVELVTGACNCRACAARS